MSSSRPGASPTNITRAVGLPSAKTSCVAVAFKAQPSNFSSMARNSSSVFAFFTASRAAMAASSGAGGAGVACAAFFWFKVQLRGDLLRHARGWRRRLRCRKAVDRNFAHECVCAGPGVKVEQVAQWFVMSGRHLCILA